MTFKEIVALFLIMIWLLGFLSPFYTWPFWKMSNAVYFGVILMVILTSFVLFGILIVQTNQKIEINLSERIINSGKNQVKLTENSIIKLHIPVPKKEEIDELVTMSQSEYWAISIVNEQEEITICTKRSYFLLSSHAIWMDELAIKLSSILDLKYVDETTKVHFAAMPGYIDSESYKQNMINNINVIKPPFQKIKLAENIEINFQDQSISRKETVDKFTNYTLYAMLTFIIIALWVLNPVHDVINALKEKPKAFIPGAISGGPLLLFVILAPPLITLLGTKTSIVKVNKDNIERINQGILRKSVRKIPYDDLIYISVDYHQVFQHGIEIVSRGKREFFGLGFKEDQSKAIDFLIKTWIAGIPIDQEIQSLFIHHESPEPRPFIDRLISSVKEYYIFYIGGIYMSGMLISFVFDLPGLLTWLMVITLVSYVIYFFANSQRPLEDESQGVSDE